MSLESGAVYRLMDYRLIILYVDEIQRLVFLKSEPPDDLPPHPRCFKRSRCHSIALGFFTNLIARGVLRAEP